MDLESYNFSIRDHPFMKDIYEALEDDDTSVVVITALNILRRIHAVPHVFHTHKNEKISEGFRNSGNKSLKLKKYQEALEYYNKALMYAPNKSRAMKLAYGNRSYILLQKLQFLACVNDVEMALDIPSAPDIDMKLKTRLLEAVKFRDIEINIHIQSHAIYGASLLKLEKPHSDIPCASSVIDVVRETRGPTVVAKHDIKVGTLLAKEEAFTLALDSVNILDSCYYCTKKSLNLIPCDGCCHVLFCDIKCRQNSLNEGHSIECQIMDHVIPISASLPTLVIKNCLKIRQKCKSWTEFIDASHCIGRERLKKSSIKEIYDVNEKFSLLCVNEDRVFVHGIMNNTCFIVAVVLHHLESVKNFLPEDDGDKKKAMRALARVMMFLIVNRGTSSMSPVVNIAKGVTLFSEGPNVGSFSFLDKLRHSCVPNAMAINVNRKMVVVACQPIAAGTPITVHCLGSHLKPSTQMNNTSLFWLSGIVCNCVVCAGKCVPPNKKSLNEQIEKKLKELNFVDVVCPAVKDVVKIYPRVCTIMALLKDAPYSEEYQLTKQCMIECLLTFSDYECRNSLLDNTKIKPDNWE